MNNHNRFEFPAYFKLAMLLLSGVLIFFILGKAASILIPVSFAFLISLLLQPFYRRLLKWKVPPALAAIFSIILVLIFLAVIVFFMGTQIANITQDLPAIGNKLNAVLDRAQQFLEEKFGINQEEQTGYLKEGISNFSKQGSNFFANAVTTTTRAVTFTLLLVIPLFFFLYYKDFLTTFLLSAVKDTEHSKLKSLLTQVEDVVQSYIGGLFIVILIIAVMNTVGLMIIGVDYAIFFGITAALLNIIPFIGVFIGSLLPIVYSALTMDSLWVPVAVAGLFWLVQFLEGNIITPNIVGGKVSINPFAAILALFIGGQVWGAAGMILFIPFTGILKVFLDNIEATKPYGFLLGEPGGKKYSKDRDYWKDFKQWLGNRKEKKK